MTEAQIEAGFAKVEAGSWLSCQGQPAAYRGEVKMKGLRGFIVPDRAAVRVFTTTDMAWFGVAERPFLARLDALPDVPLNVVASKLLLAPTVARKGAQSLKLVPFSFNRARPVTAFQQGWVVTATASRVTRVTLEEGQTLSVKPEALVAWIGKKPSGFCPKLSLLDMLLPRGPRSLAFVFHGPATVWFEGAAEVVRVLRGPYRMGVRQ